MAPCVSAPLAAIMDCEFGGGLGMSVLLRVLVLLLAVLPMVPAVAAPLEAYGGLPSIESINISPDGTKLAVSASTGEGRMLVIKTISDGAVQSYPVGAIKVRDRKSVV